MIICLRVCSFLGQVYSKSFLDYWHLPKGFVLDTFRQDELAAVNQTDTVQAFVTEGLEGLGIPTAET